MFNVSVSIMLRFIYYRLFNNLKIENRDNFVFANIIIYTRYTYTFICVYVYNNQQQYLLLY